MLPSALAIGDGRLSSRGPLPLLALPLGRDQHRVMVGLNDPLRKISGATCGIRGLEDGSHGHIMAAGGHSH